MIHDILIARPIIDELPLTPVQKNIITPGEIRSEWRGVELDMAQLSIPRTECDAIVRFDHQDGEAYLEVQCVLNYYPTLEA